MTCDDASPQDQPPRHFRNLFPQVTDLKMDELVCKPGPVPGGLSAIPFGDHPSRCAVADALQRFTRRLGRAALERLRTPLLTVRTSGKALNLAPGGVYRAAPVARHAGGLLHHRFTLTPSAEPEGPSSWRSIFCGTFPQLALGCH